MKRKKSSNGIRNLLEMWRIGLTMRDSSIGGTDLSAVKFPNEEKIAPTNEEKIAPKRWYRHCVESPGLFSLHKKGSPEEVPRKSPNEENEGSLVLRSTVRYPQSLSRARRMLRKGSHTSATIVIGAHVLLF